MTLRVIVQIVPFGDEERVREIGRLDISNTTYVGTSENEYGNVCDYVVRGHRRSDGFWPLVRKALDALPNVTQEGR